MSSPDDLSDLVQRLERESTNPDHPHVPEPELRRRPANQVRRKRRLVLISAVTALFVCGGTAAAVAVAASSSGANTAAEKPAKTQAPAPAETPVETTAPATPEPTSEPDPEPTETPKPDPAGKWDVDTPDSLQVVVNKQRPFDPADWTPDDLVMPDVPNANGQPLRAEAAEHLEQMYAESVTAGVPFAMASAFRDFNLQTTLFDNYVAADGVEAAETYSARPGFSEHQTGLVVDIAECLGCALGEAFGEMPEGIWARDNAYRFGFVLRYHQGEDATTGYTYEPWHFRYVGVEVATEMHEQGILNLEDFFGLEPAPTY